MIEVEKTIFYKAVGSEIEIFNHINQLQLPLLLKVPTGSGKSRFIEYMANEMAKKLVTVSPETTIKQVAEILATKEFHALPVVEGKLLVGIVTTTDIIKYLIDQY